MTQLILNNHKKGDIMFVNRNLILSFILILFTSTNFSQQILYPIVQNGLWGYIDSTGAEIIQPKFIQCGSFSEGQAFVKKGSNNYEGFVIVDDIGYINIKNEFRSISKFFSGFDDAKNFNEGRVAARQQGVGIFTSSKWGFLDTALNIVIKPLYTRVGDFSEGLAWVEDKKMFLFFVVSDIYGYVNLDGELVIPSRFELAGNFSEGLANITLDGKKGFINKLGEIIIEPRFEAVGKFSQGLAPVKVGHKWGFIDKNNLMVIPPTYDDARSFFEGLALVEYSGRWGFIDFSGKLVIPPRFKEVSDFSEGLAPALITDKWGYIDNKGNIKIEPQFDYAYGFIGDRALVKIDDKLCYINSKGIYVWKQIK
jgi:hypothetical protein